MKQTALILLCSLALAVNLQAQKIPNLKPFKTLPETELTPTLKKDHWGYADPKGKMVIKAVFDAAEPFRPVTSGGVTMDVAKICIAGKWGFITLENAYLFMPEYDALTDFDEGGTAVGTVNETKSLLGVHPSMSAKGAFQTLAGDVLMMNLTEIEPFNANGVAKASERSRWGLVNRMGAWVLPADNDALEERDGMFYITRGGKDGVVAQDGHVLINPIYDYLEWQADKEQFIAKKNGKYGILYRNGKERYPCIFDRVPVESSRGYVEMWQGDTPALFIPDDRLYTVDEYDEILYKSGSYTTNPFLPDWMKKHLGGAALVTIVSDLENPVDIPDDYNGDDYSAFSYTLLKCGRVLSDALNEFFDYDYPVPPEALSIFDEGDLLFVGSHAVEEYHRVQAFELTGREDGWETGACGPYTIRKKERILADNGEWLGGFVRELTPTCFNRAGESHIPVLRYEYHTWGGRPVVFLGDNIPPDSERTDGTNDAWRVLITGSASIPLGDYLHSDNGDFREESFLRVHPAGPDGIAVYEIQQQSIDYTEDEDNPIRGPKKTVACGFVGMTRPFFTQALFESAHDLEGGMTEVKLDGEWKRLSINEIKAMDPFRQPEFPSEGNASLGGTADDETIPFQLVEVKPSFNGGDANEFSKWVNTKLVYPEIAKENGVQGRVSLQFTVETDGRVTNVKVLRGVDEALDREAVRVVSSSPKWKPGKQKGVPVRVTYTFPVIFQLRDVKQ